MQYFLDSPEVDTVYILARNFGVDYYEALHFYRLGQEKVRKESLPESSVFTCASFHFVLSREIKASLTIL